VLIVVSKYSNKKAKPTPIIPPNTTAMSIIKIGRVSTGVGIAFVSGSDKIITLSTFIKSTISSWNTATVALAIAVANAGFSSFTVTDTTCESSSLKTVILSASVFVVISKSNTSITSLRIALLVIMTLYVLISSTFVRIIPESICILSDVSCSL